MIKENFVCEQREWNQWFHSSVEGVGGNGSEKTNAADARVSVRVQRRRGGLFAFNFVAFAFGFC
jgi:hypothetical protein